MTKELRISDILKKLGVAANLKGYYYLKEGIALSLDNMEMVDSITKELYPAVAKKHNTTASRVERGIRHAIETAWLIGDIALQNILFGYSVSNSKGKPTNSQFIATIADYILMTQEE